MQVALLLIGVILLSAGIQGKQSQLASLVVSDFSGAGSFWYFVGGIVTVGALGYYQPFATLSKLVLLLIIIVLLLSNHGFFAEFQTALASAAAGPVGSSSVAVPSAASSTSAGTASNPGVASPIPGNPGLSFNPFQGLPSFLNPGNIPGLGTTGAGSATGASGQ